MLRLERAAHDAAGRPVQPRLAQAASGDPVRAAAAAGARARLRRASRRPTRTCSSSSRTIIRLPQALLEYRALAKLKSTYTDKLPSDDQRAHRPRAHRPIAQAVAVTGRLSSTDPNLQNIPIRTAGRAGASARRSSRRRARAHRLGRLLADRAAHHGAPVGRRGAAARVRDGDGHPSRDGGGGVRRCALGGASARSSAATPR